MVRGRLCPPPPPPRELVLEMRAIGAGAGAGAGTGTGAGPISNPISSPPRLSGCSTGAVSSLQPPPPFPRFGGLCPILVYTVP